VLRALAFVAFHRHGHEQSRAGGINPVTQGKVKWFNAQKGWGFITTDEGQDVFVHYSAIGGDGFRTLQQGDRVQFEVGDGEKGLQASKVAKVDG
jgi:CspA family cold shock protein